MNLIRCDENSVIVNLENVACIYPALAKTEEMFHKIHFIYAAINDQDPLESEWVFEKKCDFMRAVKHLELLATYI